MNELPVYCTQCGRMVPPGNSFCGACGGPLGPRDGQAATGTEGQGRSGRRPPARSTTALVASVVVALGSFAGWDHLAEARFSAWRLSLGGVLTGRHLTSGLPVGTVLIACALAGTVFALGRAPDAVGIASGAAVLTIVLLALVRALTSAPRMAPGVGMLLSAAGGLVLLDVPLWRRPRTAIGDASRPPQVVPGPVAQPAPAGPMPEPAPSTGTPAPAAPSEGPPPEAPPVA